MSIRFGFAGFQHGHIFSLHRKVVEAQDVKVVAAAEDDPGARAAAEARDVRMTHPSALEMIRETDCEVIAVGEYFSRRGELAVAALRAGKHVIVDKPLCTDLATLDEIQTLSSEKGLKVGCMLTMRSSRPMNAMRNLVQEGAVGEVHAISFGGQHPLNLGSRASWYFEPGKHGGTITDIGIHAADMLPWMTGLEFRTVEAARCWNAFAPEFPHFKDGGQMMLTMANDCGVLGDVSYFMPDNGASREPFYWRVTVYGREGILETATGRDEVTVAGAGGLERRPAPPVEGGGYFEGFLSDIGGETGPDDLDTRQVLKASRTVLLIQQAADENLHGVSLVDG